MATIRINGGEVELSRYDLAMAKAIDKVADERDRERKWKAQLDALVAAVGKDEVEQALGAVRINDVDLIELEGLYDAMVAAYEQPRDESTADLIERRLSGIDVDRLAQVLELTERANAMSSRQGFTRVV